MAATAVGPAADNILGSMKAEEKLGLGIHDLPLPLAVKQEYPSSSLVEAPKYAAAHTTEGIVAYEPNKISDPASTQKLSYKALLSQAKANAGLLRQKAPAKIRLGCPVLVHFDTAVDSIVWYWSVLLTGAVPVLTGPNMFNQNTEDQRAHLENLYTTLNGPSCLTRRSLRGPFDAQTRQDRIDTYLVEDITSTAPAGTDPEPPELQPEAGDLANNMPTPIPMGILMKIQPATAVLVSSRASNTAPNVASAHPTQIIPR